MILLAFSAAAADMPVSWCYTSVGRDTFEAEVQAAWDAWEEAAPCVIEDVPLGECESSTGADVEFLFGDPNDELADGTTSATYPGDPTRIVFNEGDWYTDAQIAAGECTDGIGLDAFLRHELGHFLGLPHTCDDGEACTDPDDAAAVMYWSADVCEDRTVNSADAALVRAAYGTGGALEGGTDISGAVPLDVCFDVADDYAVAWSFGDGATDSGESVCHTYAEEGVYEVTATWELADECAGELSPYATVTACDAPHAPDGGALIGYSAIDLEVYTENNVEASTPACLAEAAWQVSTLDGEVVAGSDEWEPTFSLPESGTYNVSVVFTGVGGTAWDSFEITVSEPESDGGGGEEEEEGQRECGCSASLPPSSGGELGRGAIWLLAALAVRRRR